MDENKLQQEFAALVDNGMISSIHEPMTAIYAIINERSPPSTLQQRPREREHMRRLTKFSDKCVLRDRPGTKGSR
jgi:hypothetical protein